MAIFTAIGAAAAAAFFGGSALAASIISVGLAVTANLAFGYFTRQSQKPPTVDKRVALASTRQFGAETNISTICGRSSTMGHHQYYAAWGEGDRYNADVYTLANGWCDGLDPEIIFYGQKHTLIAAAITGSEDEHWKVDGFGDLISLRFYSGKPGQVADTKLVADTAALDRPFQADMKYTAQAYVVFERDFDQDKFADGEPDPTFVMRGLRAYNWRKDDTVPGGVGAHRIDDQSTWEWTENPAILRAAFQMGIKGRVSGRTILGQGVPFGGLHLASYTTAANACDALRTVNGRTFATYSVGMVVDSSMDHTEVLKDFDEAMAGYTLNSGGLQGVIVGAPQVPSFNITEKDVRTDASQTFRNRKKSLQLYNNMTGQFMSAEALWNPESLEPVTVNADVVADKRDRTLAYDFTQVHDPDVAQYLLNVRYRQGRFGGSDAVPVKDGLGRTIEAGDWGTYNNKTWICMGKEPGEGGLVLQLAETSSTIYDETDVVAGPIITAPTPTPGRPQLALSNFDIDKVTIAGAENEQASLLFTWDAFSDPTIVAVDIYYRVVGETDFIKVRDNSPEDGRFVVAGLLSTTGYEGQAQVITDPPRSHPFSPLVAVTTDSVSTTPIPDESISRSALQAGLQSVFASFNRRLEQVEQQAETANTGATLGRLDSYEDGEAVRALLASYGEQTDARIVDVETVIANEVEALASKAVLVEATAGENTATGLMKIEAAVSPDGLTSSYGFLAQGEFGGSFAEASFQVAVVSDENDPSNLTSYVQVDANRFLFQNGVQAFTINEDGAFLKDIFVERIRSSPALTDRGFDINGLTGTWRFWRNVP